MWVFFRNDELGASPERFARVLGLFERYSHRLNTATSASLIPGACVSLPADQAADYLQVVAMEGARSEDILRLGEAFTNFFPCYVGENPPAGFLMTSAPRESGLPNFGTFLDLQEGPRLSAREIFQRLARRNEAGEEFSGLRLRHGRMTEEDFAILEELLHNLYKRSIPTSFFSDFIPGYERYCDADSGHV